VGNNAATAFSTIRKSRQVAQAATALRRAESDLAAVMSGMIEASATRRPGNALHFELCVDDGHVVLAHTRGANRMAHRHRAIANEIVEILARCRPGQNFALHKGLRLSGGLPLAEA
jgi:hypothetical protein